MVAPETAAANSTARSPSAAGSAAAQGSRLRRGIDEGSGGIERKSTCETQGADESNDGDDTGTNSDGVRKEETFSAKRAAHTTGIHGPGKRDFGSGDGNSSGLPQSQPSITHCGGTYDRAARGRLRFLYAQTTALRSVFVGQQKGSCLGRAFWIRCRGGDECGSSWGAICLGQSSCRGRGCRGAG